MDEPRTLWVKKQGCTQVLLSKGHMKLLEELLASHTGTVCTSGGLMAITYCDAETEKSISPYWGVKGQEEEKNVKIFTEQQHSVNIEKMLAKSQFCIIHKL